MSTENNRSDSFRLESSFKKSCFFCLRNSYKNNIKNEKSLNYQGISDVEDMTEKLRILMKSFNIERRFSDKLEENRDVKDKRENANLKSSLAKINSYDFKNYYPKNLSFILLDLRISVDKKEKFYDYKAGFLPMTVVVEQEELIDDHVIYQINNL